MRVFGNQEIAGPGVDEIRDACEACAKVLHLAGIPVKAYHDPDLPQIMALPGNERAQLLRDLVAYTEALEVTLHTGFSVRDSRALLQRALNRFSFTCDSDVFERFSNDDVVEIYTPKHQQIFRNATFFRFVNGSIEELVYAEWSRVTRRELRITFKLFHLAALITTGTLRRTHLVSPKEIPEHLVTWLKQPDNRFLMQVKGVSPLWNEKGSLGAVLIWHHCRYP